jgi:1-deoxy-D-xylulose-5-phosphate synthase
MSGKFYAAAREGAKRCCARRPPLFEFARRFEEHAKGMVVPGTMFEEFGFNYVGPIDGHDLDALIPTLENLREQAAARSSCTSSPSKGQGYELAEADPVNYHGPGKFDPAQGIQEVADRRPSPPSPRSSATGSATWPSATRGWSASRRPCARAPGMVRVRASASRRATSTSASPSSTRSPSPPAWPARA